MRAGSLVLLAAVVTAVVLGLLVVARRGAGPPDPSATADAAAMADDIGFALWARRGDGTAVRWDPCGTIAWVLQPDGAPADAAGLVAAAFRRVGAVTGLATRYLGTTAEVPAVDRPPFQPDRYGDRWAPVLVAWVAPHAGDLPLRDTDRAISVPVAVDGVFVSGQIALNAHQTLSGDFADRSRAWGSTLVHEVGHLVGLDHVDDPEQLMYRFPGEGPVRFGSGDLAGLGAVGDAAGGGRCLDAGPPRPIRVDVAPRR